MPRMTMRAMFAAVLAVVAFALPELQFDGPAAAASTVRQAASVVSDVRGVAPIRAAQVPARPAAGNRWQTASVATSAVSLGAPSDDKFNFEDPATYSDIATALGIVATATTLFVGWQRRKIKRKSDQRREQQEWAIRAAHTTAAIDRELEAEQAADAERVFAAHRSERLNSLVEQLTVGDSAFGLLNNPGDAATRAVLRTKLLDLLDSAVELGKRYRWISALQDRLRETPGDGQVSQMLLQERTSADGDVAMVLEQTKALRRAIGGWLRASDALVDVEGRLFGEADDHSEPRPTAP